MFKRVAVILAIRSISAQVSTAADLTEAPGGKLNEKDPGSLPVTLQIGDLISGPATVKTAAGDTLVLSADGVLEVQEPEDDVEFFFLKQGGLRGEIGDKTRIAIPTGWIGVGTGKTAEIYARTTDAVRGYVQVRRGIALLQYRPIPGGFPEYAFLLTDGQGVEVWSPSPGNAAFMTDQDNPSAVQLSAQVTRGTDVTLWIPKASAGGMIQEDGGARTLVYSEGGSWKGEDIRGEIRVSGALTDNAVLGPGVLVRINNSTGRVEGKGVDFDIIPRDISLTSEFTSVATSNFFGTGN
jgi:hypothetical protein